MGVRVPSPSLFLDRKKSSPGGTRTLNLLLRKQTPYPLGYKAATTKKRSVKKATKKGAPRTRTGKKNGKESYLRNHLNAPNTEEKLSATSNQHANKTKKTNSKTCVGAGASSSRGTCRLAAVYRHQRSWSSGMMHPCHGCDPGSIPGLRSVFFFFLLQETENFLHPAKSETEIKSCFSKNSNLLTPGTPGNLSPRWCPIRFFGGGFWCLWL